MFRNQSQLSSLSLIPVRWSLKRPFVTSLGHKAYSHNILVRVVLSGGVIGFGEASSSLAMPFQTVSTMGNALKNLFHVFRGEDVRDIKKIMSRAWPLEKKNPTAVAAFESALWDALGRYTKTPLWKLWGGKKKSVESLMSVSAVSPSEVAIRVKEGTQKGFRVFKLKLNGYERNDVNQARVCSAVRVNSKAQILVDPNQSYSPKTLSIFLKGIKKLSIPITLVEEPFRKKSWKKLSDYRSSIPFILDESIQTPQDAQKVCSENLSQGVNVKLAKSGILRSLSILEAFKKKSSFLFMIGCMAESNIGLSHSVHFACGLGIFQFLDLDSDLLLSNMPSSGGYRREGPYLTVSETKSGGTGSISKIEKLLAFSKKKG